MDIRVDSWAWFEKRQLGYEKIRRLKLALTVTTRATHPKAEAHTLRLWTETKTEFGVPREYFFGNAQLNHNVELFVTEGLSSMWPGDIKFVGQLRPGQRLAFQRVRPILDRKLGGIVKAATGWGKTVFACALFADLGVPAIVFVQRDNLMSQWIKAFEKFLPQAEYGVIQGPRCEFSGKHIAVAMMQSFYDHDYPPTLFAWPGLLFFDEVHRVGAPTFSTIPGRFPARWRVGLSATPKRKDGADDAFLYHIGPMIHAGDLAKLKPYIKRIYTRFRVLGSGIDPEDVSDSLLFRWMMHNSARNLLIVNTLLDAVKAGRRILILSKRLKHLDILENLFVHVWKQDNDIADIPSLGRCVGGVKGAKLDEAKEAQVIFATYQFAAEGFDVPPLDTLFLVMPTSDAEQAVGRILREYEGKKVPIVVDFRDDAVPLFYRWALNRERLYERIAA